MHTYAIYFTSGNCSVLYHECDSLEKARREAERYNAAMERLGFDAAMERLGSTRPYSVMRHTWKLYAKDPV